jgi:hypothetical protein
MILETDIKLMQSERLTETDDGGGRMTANEVVDGLSNNLFPDVSELDRTYGRVSLRKCYPAVVTATVDTYYGANFIVSRPPTDPLVHVSLFKTLESDAWFDERSDAQDKVESFVTLGTLSRMKLLGNHYEGQRAMVAYQLTNDPLPEVGSVYALIYLASTQYVRLTDISHEIVAYTDSQGEFLRREITMTLSDPLRFYFAGGEPSRASSYQPPTVIHNTNTVEAVNYYGITPLALAADYGAMQVHVQDYKLPLLPSTQSESALLDIQAGGTRSLVIDAGARDVTLAKVAHTAITEVSAVTRQYNYVRSLYPLPGEQTLEVSYRSRGKWYTIYDQDGTGGLIGDGSGSINYTTGSVVVTLKDLPDVDTAILWGWGSRSHYEVRTLADIEPYRWEGTASLGAVKPTSFALTWEYPTGTVRTATDNGAGAITGDGSGEINYSTGKFWCKPNTIPQAGSTPQIAYQYWEAAVETFSVVPDGNGVVTITAAQQIAPRSLDVEWVVIRNKTRYEKQTTQPAASTSRFWQAWAYTTTEETFLESTVTTRVTATDIANGVLVPVRGANVAGAIGSVNYVTREIRFTTTVPVTHEVTNYYRANSGTTWETKEDVAAPASPVAVTLHYRPVTAATPGNVETLPAMPLRINLTPFCSDSVVPDSVQFLMGATTYIDRDGSIYRDVNPGTGVGTYSGTIDYASGVVELTDWVGGATSIVLQSLLTMRGQWSEAFMRFRTPGAPLRPGGFYLTATDINGNLLMGSANPSGVISGDHMDGSIDVETGIVEVRFGDLVLDSSLTPGEKLEPWYNPADIVGGYIWRPLEIFPQTARYNCVVYVYLPLSADILGLDPVRLPMDGKVPIFRVGDVVVVHNTDDINIESPYNNQIIHTGLLRLAYAKLYDGNDNPIPTDRYTVNLDAGTVTLGSVVGLVTPFRLEHRIEDMALVSDLQINGTLTLTRGMSHSYPLGSYVSGAVIIGDLFAHVAHLFSQATWTSVWSDTLIGSTTTAQYNDTLYPVTVLNRDCIQERWALIFTSSTVFRCVGEFSGQIATGDINTNFAPNNPATGHPYFTVLAAGWGSGWTTGNVLRFNTLGANCPIWIARTVLQGEATAHTDQFRVQVRGDADTP